jgi:hypothetical protein
MVTDLEQMCSQMEQVSREFQLIQERWSTLLKQVHQISQELPALHEAGGYGTTTFTPGSYGAQYTVGHPYGTSMKNGTGRQSEHTVYGRMM